LKNTSVSRTTKGECHEHYYSERWNGDSETDFTEDLKKFDVPTLVLHGEDDQIVPVKNSAVKSARLIKGAQEIYYPGAPHGITATHQDQINADLLAFIAGQRSAAA
jgi:pimeloyl-ACP methyl ester carboxylesterase